MKDAKQRAANRTGRFFKVSLTAGLMAAAAALITGTSARADGSPLLSFVERVIGIDHQRYAEGAGFSFGRYETRAQPVRVHISIAPPYHRYGGKYGHQAHGLEAALRTHLARTTPPHIQFVRQPSHADIVIHAEETQQITNLAPLVHRKVRRTLTGRGSGYYRADYDRRDRAGDRDLVFNKVKARAVGAYYYQLTINRGGRQISRPHSLQVAQDFTYATDVCLIGPRGVRTVSFGDRRFNRLPAGLQRLMYRAGAEFRHELQAQLDQSAAEKLADEVRAVILRFADQRSRTLAPTHHGLSTGSRLAGR